MQEIYKIIIAGVSVVVTGLMSWLTVVLVNWLNQKIKDKKIAGWATEVATIIMNGVQQVYQEFVEGLKNNGKFDEAAQKEAKQRAYNVIVNGLRPELQDYITKNSGDMKEYILNRIESMIYQLKNK